VRFVTPAPAFADCSDKLEAVFRIQSFELGDHEIPRRGSKGWIGRWQSEAGADGQRRGSSPPIEADAAAGQPCEDPTTAPAS